MQQRFLKDFLKSVIIPCLVLVLIYLLFTKSDFEFFKNNKVITLSGNSGLVPKINWEIGWGGQPEKVKIAKEFVEEYNFLHNNLEINLGIIDNDDKASHARNIVKMIKTNIYDWDIVWTDETVYYKVSELLGDKNWGQKYLVDFQNIEGFILTQRAEILKNPDVLAHIGGILPGPLFDGFYGVIWYNKKVAGALGLEVKDREMNFNDLLKYAQRIDEYNRLNNTKIALFVESKDWFGVSKILLQYLLRNRLEQMNIFGIPSKDTALYVLKNTLNDFEKLSQYNPLIESHNVLIRYDAKKALLENSALFMIEKTSLINELFKIDSINSNNILPAELPSYGYNKSYIGSFQPSFAVFKNTPNRNAAIELIKSFSTPQYAEKWARQTKNPTGIAVNINENYLENDPYNEFLIYIAKKYQYNVRYSNYTSYIFGNNNAYLYKLMDDNLRLLLSKQITSEDAFNNINSNLAE